MMLRCSSLRSARSTRCGWEDGCARAQVAKGTLYLHYKDKEDLFQGIMNDGLLSLVDRIEESLSDEMAPEEKLLTMNRESFRYFERNHFFLDVIQRVDFFRYGARSACFEETRARLQGILLRIFREFPSRARFSDQELKLEVVAHSGMMKEILHTLPRPWPEDLPERLTLLFLHGIGASVGAGSKKKQPARGRRAASSDRVLARVPDVPAGESDRI